MKARGRLWANRARKLLECSAAQRVIPGGETHVCQPSEGTQKNCSLSAHVSWFTGVRFTSHVLQQEKEELCVLCVVEAFGGYADSDDVEGAQYKGHTDSQRGPPPPFGSSTDGEKTHFEPACAIADLHSLPVRLRRRPTFRDISPVPGFSCFFFFFLSIFRCFSFVFILPPLSPWRPTGPLSLKHRFFSNTFLNFKARFWVK